MKDVRRVEVAQVVRLLRQGANYFITLGTISSCLKAAAEDAVAARVLPTSELEALEEEIRQIGADNEEILQIAAALEECGCRYVGELPNASEAMRACQLLSAVYLFVIKQGLALAARKAAAMPDQLAAGGPNEWRPAKESVEVWMRAVQASWDALDGVQEVLAAFPNLAAV